MTTIEKLKLQTRDFAADKAEQLAQLFPECIKESVADDGTITNSIDVDQLLQEINATVVGGPRERYNLDWPGKREALVLANSSITKTLRPCRDESVDFDTTKNLFIEGDNLDALKLLQETYLNQVKLIYIDPPYNTGKDFIYDDDFAVEKKEFDLFAKHKDSQGGRLVANPESNGRFHSDWLTMIYSRLKLAKNLLNEDGVVFVSIDDGEVANLRKVCDELFGEQNFVTQIIWKKRSTPPNDKAIGAQHDYILVYAKNYTNSTINLRERSDEQVARYKNPDNHPKGPWAAGDLMANVKGGRYVDSLHYAIVNPRTGQEHFPSSNGNWRFNKAKIEQLIASDEIYFGADDSGRPKLKRFLCDVKSGISWTSLWDFAPLNTAGSKEMSKIFGNLTVFENPKPVGLLEHIVKAGSNPDSIVLDFFCGSATTAHAVMSVNGQDGGSRRHIMVQLPEECGEKSEAAKAGFANISDIAKERIRRAGSLVKEAHPENASKLDLGFRVLKVDGSNMKDVYYSPDNIKQVDLFDQVNNIQEGRTSEDLLFQVLLDWGVDLSLPITQEDFEERKEVFFVDGNALAACFELDIDEELVKKIASRKPIRVVFRDSSFGSDSVKINVEQIFKLLSPNTEIRTI